MEMEMEISIFLSLTFTEILHSTHALGVTIYFYVRIK